MTKSAFKITGKPPMPDLAGRFMAASSLLLEWRRPVVQRQGKRMHELAVEEAPKGETGKFAEGIRWRSFVRGGEIGFSLSDPQPLGTWIRGGTRAHAIPKPARPPGKPLRFFWAKGPMGAGMYSFFNVWHPGTKPNKYIGRAYKLALPGMRSDLRLLGGDFTRFIRGEGKTISGGTVRQ